MKMREISHWLTDHFEGTDKFLVDVLVKPGNRIYVFIDGDHGVTIEDCVEVSRFLESHMDRESLDFELNVSSAGADQPIRLPRQYHKNIGRSVKVERTDGRVITGKLLEAGEKGILVSVPGDKKKKIPQEDLLLEFDQIKEAKVIISFK